VCETIGFYEIGWRGHTTKRTPPSYETKEEVAVPNLMELEQAKMGIVLVVDDDFDENIWRKITSIFVARENR